MKKLLSKVIQCKETNGFLSGKMTKRISMVIGLLSIATIVFAQTVMYKIYIIGDSTVCNYAASKYPWAGWGQELSYFFKTGTVTISNNAIGGRSSKSFYVEGRWATVVSQLKTGDFVLIQFGHNDRDYSDTTRYADTNTYKTYLRLYVKESRAKGAIPVFVSPMNMNTWTGTALREVFTETSRGANYRGAMMNVATELSVPFIDLEQKSATFMKSAGQAYCTSFHFMGLQVGEYANYPDGYSDGTHFQEMGALINARMVAEGIQELSTHADVGKLAAVLAPLYKVTVTPNKTGTGLVTVSGEFPQGATVTVKVMPDSDETFEYWADASGKSLTVAKLYSFTMGAAAVTFNAMFKGGSAVAVMQNNVARVPCDFNIAYVNKRISVHANQNIQSIKIFDMNGKQVLSNHTVAQNVIVNVDAVRSGVYCVVAATSDGISKQMVKF